MHIYPECFNKEGGCFHYASEFVDSKPVLASGKELQSSPGFECHNSSSSSKRSTSDSSSHHWCGNPWNFFSEEYANEVRDQQPQEYLTIQPTHGRRPVVDIVAMDTPKAVENIIDYIGSDCWSVYIRDVTTHSTKQKLYFGQDTWDEATQAHDPVTRARQSAVRDTLMHPQTINDLLDSISDSEELCISLGCSPFIDVYVHKMRCGDVMMWLFARVQVDIEK